MTGSSHIQRALLVLACLPLLSPCAGAWSNGGYSADPNSPDYGTHDWIADASLAMQTSDVTFLKSTYHSEFLLGTEAADNPEYIGDTSNHHIYFTSAHQVDDDICALRASQIYQTALGYLEANDYDNAAYDIGVMAHYVADPGVFGHTMGAYTDWGTETHHSDYENGIESRIGSMAAPTGTPLGDSDAYAATLSLGEIITFGSGTIQSNVWMDANYNWADATFVASATASLYRSVAAVAAAINHLMIEAGSSPPTPPPPTPPPPTPTPEAPQPPVDLTVVVQDSHVVLTWSPPANDGGASITSYKIHRATNPEDPSLVTVVPGDTHGWNDESVAKGKTYYYWVAAENSAGSSDLSQVVSVTVPKKTDSMTLPIAVSAISIALATGGVLFWRRKARARPPH